MSDSVEFLGLNNLVEGMVEALQQAPLRRRYPGHNTLANAVAQVVQRALAERLEPLHLEYGLWRGPAELDSQGVQPVYAFNTDFFPDLVIEVSGRPAVAFTIRQLRADPSNQIRIGIGEAVIYSHQYPAVIAFWHGLQQHENLSYLLDRAIADNLWYSHKVRLVLWRS